MEGALDQMPSGQLRSGGERVISHFKAIDQRMRVVCMVVRRKHQFNTDERRDFNGTVVTNRVQTLRQFDSSIGSVRKSFSDFAGFLLFIYMCVCVCAVHQEMFTSGLVGIYEI